MRFSIFRITTLDPCHRRHEKDPKKVEAGKRLAAINHKREAKKREEAQNSGMNQYYGIGAAIAVLVIGGLGSYIYQTKKGEQGATAGRVQVPALVGSNLQTHNKIILNHTPRLTSLRWIKSLLYYKNGQEEYSK